MANSSNRRTGSAALSTVTALREADAFRARGRRAEDDGGCGVEELFAMVLADAERVEPRMIGALDLRDQLVQAIRRADRTTVLGERRREAVDADFHGVRS